MNKAFESNATATTLGNRDSEIISYEAPSVQYEQIRLNDNFKQYFETSLISQNFFKKKFKKKHHTKSLTNCILVRKIIT